VTRPQNNAMQLTGGRLDPYGNTIVGEVIVKEGKLAALAGDREC
jgi:hypothetical protein